MQLHAAVAGSSFLLFAPCAWALAVGMLHDTRAAQGGVVQNARSTPIDSPLPKAVRWWKMQGLRTCLTVDGHFMGGLSNTMGFVNTALEFAIRSGITFVMPEIDPPGHDVGKSFADLFGRPVPSGAKKYCDTQCNLTRPKSSLGSRIWMTGRDGGCFPDQLDVSCSWRWQPPAAVKDRFGCDRMVTFHSHTMFVHYNYNTTYAFLREAYWRAHPKVDRQVSPHHRRDVVMHVRLGDVVGGRDNARAEWEKYFPPLSYYHLLSALTQVLPVECFRFTIVTDGPHDGSDIKAISEYARELDITDMTIHDQETGARKSFRMMTHADVLLCGGSGFSRLAAVLMPEDRARVCFTSESHPLGYLQNTTELQLLGTSEDTTMEQAVSLLRENVALQSLAAVC